MPGRSAIVRQLLSIVCVVGLAAQTLFPLVHASLWHSSGHRLLDGRVNHPDTAGVRLFVGAPSGSSSHRVAVECPLCSMTASSREKLSASSPDSALVSPLEVSSSYRLIGQPALEVRSGPYLSDTAPRAPPA